MAVSLVGTTGRAIMGGFIALAALHIEIEAGPSKVIRADDGFWWIRGVGDSRFPAE